MTVAFDQLVADYAWDGWNAGKAERKRLFHAGQSCTCTPALLTSQAALGGSGLDECQAWLEDFLLELAYWHGTLPRPRPPQRRRRSTTPARRKAQTQRHEEAA